MNKMILTAYILILLAAMILSLSFVGGSKKPEQQFPPSYEEMNKTNQDTIKLLQDINRLHEGTIQNNEKTIQNNEKTIRTLNETIDLMRKNQKLRDDLWRKGIIPLV